jgi:cytochrome c553
MLTKGTIHILAAIVVVGGIVAAAVAGWMVFQPGPYAFATGTPVEFAAYRGGPSPAGIPAELANADAATKGAYIARVADCAACHTAKGGHLTPKQKSASGPIPTSSTRCIAASHRMGHTIILPFLTPLIHC